MSVCFSRRIIYNILCPLRVCNRGKMTATDVHIIHHGQSLTWTESVVLLYILRIRVWQWRIEPAEIQFNSPLIANSGKRPRCKVGTLRANYPRRNFQFTRPMRTIFSSRPIYKIRKYTYLHHDARIMVYYVFYYIIVVHAVVCPSGKHVTVVIIIVEIRTYLCVTGVIIIVIIASRDTRRRASGDTVGGRYL